MSHPKCIITELFKLVSWFNPAAGNSAHAAQGRQPLTHASPHNGIGRRMDKKYNSWVEIKTV